MLHILSSLPSSSYQPPSVFPSIQYSAREIIRKEFALNYLQPIENKCKIVVFFLLKAFIEIGLDL